MADAEPAVSRPERPNPGGAITAGRVRRRLWRDRFAQAARTGAVGFGALILVIAAAAGRRGPLGFGVAARCGALGVWLDALAGRPRRPTEAASRSGADRHLGGESAYSTMARSERCRSACGRGRRCNGSRVDGGRGAGQPSRAGRAAHPIAVRTTARGRGHLHGRRGPGRRTARRPAQRDRRVGARGPRPVDGPPSPCHSTTMSSPGNSRPNWRRPPMRPLAPGTLGWQHAPRGRHGCDGFGSERRRQAATSATTREGDRPARSGETAVAAVPDDSSVGVPGADFPEDGRGVEMQCVHRARAARRATAATTRADRGESPGPQER